MLDKNDAHEVWSEANRYVCELCDKPIERMEVFMYIHDPWEAVRYHIECWKKEGEGVNGRA